MASCLKKFIAGGNKSLFTYFVSNQSLLQNAVRITPSLRRKSSNSKQLEEDEPIRYSTSKASSWSARQSRIGTRTEDDIPWFQPYAITFSLAVFLIYFCILREENDIDVELGRSLYDRIEGLEKKQLEISLEYNAENNLDTTAIKARLDELKAIEENAKE